MRGSQRVDVEVEYDVLKIVVARPEPHLIFEADPDRAEAEGMKPVPFDFERAMKVLLYHRSQRNGEPNRRTGRPRRVATREETNAALLKALAAAKRRGFPIRPGCRKAFQSRCSMCARSPSV